MNSDPRIESLQALYEAINRFDVPAALALFGPECCAWSSKARRGPEPTAA